MKYILILLSLFTNFNVQADQPIRLIEGYGDFKQVKDTDFITPKKLKVVFDVYISNEENDGVNKGINTVARFLNMHYDAGVKLKNIKAALVIHGSAGKDILTHTAYDKRYITNNPNLELLQKLHDAGVNIIVCGQTIEFKGYKRNEIIDFITVSLSAITALVSLQAQGYQIINFN
jgi:intracellular sulfur oxidation DsrE/DsrF family protein